MSKFRRLHVEALEARDVPSLSPVVAIHATDSSACETGPDSAMFTVSRMRGNIKMPLTVQYQVDPSSTASAMDYAALSGSVTIPAGQLPATINVMPVDDNMYKATESLRLAIRPMWNYRVDLSAPNAEAQIADNDQAPQVLAPVLMVIANRDFYYREYADTRAELLNAGLAVVVAAQQAIPSIPHPGSGQGSDGGIVTPNIALGDADAANYSAIWTDYCFAGCSVISV